MCIRDSPLRAPRCVVQTRGRKSKSVSIGNRGHAHRCLPAALAMGGPHGPALPPVAAREAAYVAEAAVAATWQGGAGVVPQ
eukprot:8895927-Lingulodinium_polyedra.AAC.1